MLAIVLFCKFDHRERRLVQGNRIFPRFLANVSECLFRPIWPERDAADRDHLPINLAGDRHHAHRRDHRRVFGPSRKFGEVFTSCWGEGDRAHQSDVWRSKDTPSTVTGRGEAACR